MLGFGESDAMEDQDEEEEGDEEQIDQFGVMIQDNNSMKTDDEGEERIIKHKPDEKPSKKKVGAADDIYDL